MSYRDSSSSLSNRQSPAHIRFHSPERPLLNKDPCVVALFHDELERSSRSPTRPNNWALRRSKLLSATLIIASMLALLHFSQVPLIKIRILGYQLLAPSNTRSTGPHPEYCYDPYRLSGYVERSELPEGPIESVQFIANQPAASHRLGRPSTGASPPSFIVPTLAATLLANPDAPELAFLLNRTVIFVGDSLDRNLVYHLTQETFGVPYHRFLTPETDPGLRLPGIETHQVGLGVHPKLNLTLANWFLMSVDVQEPKPYFHPGEDYPQEFQARLETFYYPLIEKGVLSGTPDMVVFNSGLWDLVYLSEAMHEEVARNESLGILKEPHRTGEPLTEAELAYHKGRFTLLIERLRARFPGPHTRLVYRTMPDSSLTLAHENAMERGRVRQIDAANVEVIQSFNQAGKPIDIIDWTWIARELMDELVDLVHFRRGANQWLYGDMILRHLRRHVEGDHDAIVWSECARYQESIGTNSSAARLGQSRSYFNPIR